MEYKFNVKMKVSYMYDYLMYHIYHGVTGWLSVILGVLVLIQFGKTIGTADVTMSIMYFIFGILFLVYLPISLYLSAGRQVKLSPVFREALTYIVNEEGIESIQGEQSAKVSWDQIQRVVSTRKSLLIYVAKGRATIFPKEEMKDQYEGVVALIKNKLNAKQVKIR